ncbi:MAG: hypothetical protein V1678_00250 [Candidatus Aenigmatarchaeota archaeon]
MNDITLLSIGLTVGFASLFYIIIRSINRKLRKYVLRFDQIKHKFE